MTIFKIVLIPPFGNIHMTINEFKAESLESQVDIVSDNGILLAYRNEGVVMYDLYNIDDFFVEFSYNLAYNEAVTMKIFQDPEELKPYFAKTDEAESSLPGLHSSSKVGVQSSFDQISDEE